MSTRKIPMRNIIFYFLISVQCSAQTCQNGGVCLVQRHLPKCYCPAGFTGQFCEIDIDECASRPCYNGGTCIDLPQGYRCLCNPGKLLRNSPPQKKYFKNIFFINIYVIIHYHSWELNFLL